MWWDKKFQFAAPKNSDSDLLVSIIPAPERPIEDKISRPPYSIAHEETRMLLGRSLVLKGELSGDEDLLIEGRFEGTINLQDHCLTVGPEAEVKAEIHASRVVVRGSVNGNIAARDRIEICKTGSVVGDLVGQGIAIEEGAYFKGSIEILRPDNQRPSEALSSRSVD